MATTALRRLDYRPLDYTIYKTHLEINLDLPITTVKARFKLKQLNNQATSFTLDGQNQTLHSLKINGADYHNYQLENLPGVQGFQNLTVNLADLTPEARKEFTLELETSFNLEKNLSLAGIYKSGDQIVSQCEANGFRQITFYFDRPDCLSEFTVRVIGDKKYQYLLSNGNKIGEGEYDAQKHYSDWHDPFPKPCYLFALVAGNFDVIDDTFVTKSGRTIDLRIFAEIGKKEQLRFAMSSLKRAMKWDEDRFNLEYDLDLFMIVATPFFNMGAMENKGLNIYNDACLIGDKDNSLDKELMFIDGCVAHEYFHNWTGDRVTCRDWFQLTLKEGLTVFRDQEYTSDTFNRTIKRLQDVELVKVHQFEEDQGPMAHPIRPELVETQDNFYTVTVYEKGAEVIRMIHTLLGEANFQKGMALYFERFDGQAVTCDDFVQAMQDASGIDLTKFKTWYSQSGTPVVDVTTKYNADTKVYTINFKQHTPATNDQQHKEPLVLPLKTQLLDAQGNTLKQLKTTDGADFKELVIVDSATHSVALANIEQAPILVTNLDFSAPVKINQEHSFAELSLIATKSENLYARNDAVNKVYQKAYEHNLARLAAGQSIELQPEIVTLYQTLLDTALENPALNALLLGFTTASQYMTTLTRDVNPQHLQQIYTTLTAELAKKFKEQALAIYQQIPVVPYQFTMEQIGIRSLRAALLRIITKDGSHKELVAQAYVQADNLTDRVGALTVSMRNNLGLTELEEQFLAMYAGNANVLDSYMTLKVSVAPDLATAEAVTKLSTYDATNPNRIRAFMSGFSQNFAVKYNTDGSFYDFLTAKIRECDSFNPQLSAGLTAGLLGYYKFAQPWQGIILDRIKQLHAGGNLSKNVQELLSKALAMADKAA